VKKFLGWKREWKRTNKGNYQKTPPIHEGRINVVVE